MSVKQHATIKLLILCKFSPSDKYHNAMLLTHVALGAQEMLRKGWSCRGYYALMGVQTNASKQEIQAAYRGLVMKHHPDRNPEAQKKEAARMFQRVQQAYSILRDPAKRKQYDGGQ